jgi:hypothetical protein
MPTDTQDLDHLLRSESPCLFLGAGFSIGGRTRAGSEVPTATALCKRIIEDLLGYSSKDPEYPELSGYGLAKVCQFARLKASTERLSDFLVGVFSQIRPADHHALLVHYPWRRIYTTNIDDLVETVYQTAGVPLHVQNMPRRVTVFGSQGTEYIKLHGCVRNPSAGLVFSPEEYIETMLRMDYRFTNLMHDLADLPFIIVGSTFDEVNIDYWLRVYELSTGASTRQGFVFVNPRPSLLLRQRVSDLNGILLEWPAGEFLRYVERSWDSSATPQRQTASLHRAGCVPLSTVRASLTPAGKYKSQLYFGDEPTWEDLYYDWDFNTPEVDLLRSRLIEERLPRLVALHGKSCGGKTCILRRFGILAAAAGYEVMDFIGRKIDLSAIATSIRSHKTRSRFLLLLDNASIYYPTVAALLKWDLQGHELTVATTARTLHHLRRRYAIADTDHEEIFVASEISPDVAKAMVMKLREKGYLGTLAGLGEAVPLEGE